jgi:hypothetical protein
MSPPALAPLLPMPIRYLIFCRQPGRPRRIPAAPGAAETGGSGEISPRGRRRLDLLARQEPQVKHILTSNSETNGHMIGINETLGYRVIGPPVRSWELPVTRAAQS